MHGCVATFADGGYQFTSLAETKAIIDPFRKGTNVTNRSSLLLGVSRSGKLTIVLTNTLPDPTSVFVEKG